MAEKSLAVKPNLDPDRRKNLAIAGAIFAAVVAILILKSVFARVGTVEVDVVVSGYGGQGLKSVVELREAGGKVLAHGETDERTGTFVVRVLPGTYTVEATVPVKETEVGLPNIYPMTDPLVVDEPGPVRKEMKFAGLEPYPGFPGRYRGHVD